jgi:hypothetical protein
MKSINDKIRIEDFKVHEIEGFGIDYEMICLTLKFSDVEHIPIFTESLYETLPDPENPGKFLEQKTGRKVQEGKITIDVFSGDPENYIFEQAEKINLQYVLPSSSELKKASKPDCDPAADPILYHNFTVDPGEWDALLEDLLRMKLIPL